MKTKKETVDQILKEMRVTPKLSRLADRIEAAHKNEILDELCDKASLSNTIYDFLNDAYGDEKHMRFQALMSIINHGAEGHFHYDEIIESLREEFGQWAIDPSTRDRLIELRNDHG